MNGIGSVAFRELSEERLACYDREIIQLPVDEGAVNDIEEEREVSSIVPFRRGFV